MADDVYSLGDNPWFTLEWGWCANHGDYRWLHKMSGTLYRCTSAGATGAIAAAAGLETVTSNGADRNIDVKYTEMQISLVGIAGDWQNFDNNSREISPNYSFERGSERAFNTYLAPLD